MLPVASFVEGMTLVSDYRDADTVLKLPTTLSGRLESSEFMGSVIPQLNGPEHIKRRQVESRIFAPASAARSRADYCSRGPGTRIWRAGGTMAAGAAQRPRSYLISSPGQASWATVGPDSRPRRSGAGWPGGISRSSWPTEPNASRTPRRSGTCSPTARPWSSTGWSPPWERLGHEGRLMKRVDADFVARARAMLARDAAIVGTL